MCSENNNMVNMVSESEVKSVSVKKVSNKIKKVAKVFNIEPLVSIRSNNNLTAMELCNYLYNYDNNNIKKGLDSVIWFNVMISAIQEVMSLKIDKNTLMLEVDDKKKVFVGDILLSSIKNRAIDKIIVILRKNKQDYAKELETLLLVEAWARFFSSCLLTVIPAIEIDYFVEMGVSERFIFVDGKVDPHLKEEEGVITSNVDLFILKLLASKMKVVKEKKSKAKQKAVNKNKKVRNNSFVNNIS